METKTPKKFGDAYFSCIVCTIVHLPFIQMDSDRDILHIICLDIQTKYIESHLE